MNYIPSAMDFPHAVYLIKKKGKQYVGITNSIPRRMMQHGEHEFITSFTVPTRREAEGVEATLHQLQKQYDDVEPFMDVEFYVNHSLWFNSANKGYPKHLRQQPQPRF
jgi:hypothetical protein